MTNRLQEISRQALDYAFEICNQSGHTNLNSNVALTLAMSKQAELIVKECVSTLNNMHLWQSVNNQNYPNSWHDAVDQGIDAIKTHFGVEE